MPRCSAGGTLSVPMSMPLYTAVESQAMMTASNRAAIASASALLPVAVGPTTATARIVSVGGGDRHAGGRARAVTDLVVERDREKRPIVRILGRQRLRRIRPLERVECRNVVRLDRTRPDNLQFSDGAVPQDEELNHHLAGKRHR